MKEWTYASATWLVTACAAAVSASWRDALFADAVVVAFFWLVSSRERFEILWRSWLIGVGAGVGMLMVSSGVGVVRQFGVHLVLVSSFHISEFVFTSYVLPDGEPVSTDSFLLNHSWAYGIASVAAAVEFVAEAYLFPGFKTGDVALLVGLLLCMSGEAVRKLAIVTAGSNFNHTVQFEKKEGHELVTRGIYSLCRHPSYVGWFVWAVGTQVILLNPVCFVCYALATWRFFQRRILEEEWTLLCFFGKAYRDYQQRVPSGLPFIPGYLGPHPLLRRAS